MSYWKKDEQTQLYTESKMHVCSFKKEKQKKTSRGVINAPPPIPGDHKQRDVSKHHSDLSVSTWSQWCAACVFFITEEWDYLMWACVRCFSTISVLSDVDSDQHFCVEKQQKHR